MIEKNNLRIARGADSPTGCNEDSPSRSAGVSIERETNSGLTEEKLGQGNRERKAPTHL